MDKNNASGSVKINTLPEWTEYPVLVYGPRKSGTTLLLNLLDGGEDLIVFPDEEVKIKFFLKTLFGDLPGAIKTYYSFSRIVDQKYDNFDEHKYTGYTKELMLQPVMNLADMLKNDIYAIYKSMIGQPVRVKCWGMKEVGGKTTEVVKLFRQLFFRGKVLMIIRNPLRVTRSVVLDRRRKGVTLGLKQLIKQTRDPVRVLSEQYKLINCPGVYTICYEDLTGDRSIAEVMGGVCRFLGIPYSKFIEHPSIFGVPVVVRTSSKNSKEVFLNKAKWYDSLTLREAIVVYLVYRIHTFVLKIKRRLDKYQVIRQVVSEQYLEPL